MERTHLLVIAVVVAALALFGLSMFSTRSDDAELAALGGSGRLGDRAGDPLSGDGGAGGAGDRRRLGAFGATGGDSGRLGGAGERGGSGGAGRSGSADSLSGGGSRSLSGGVGVSGSTRGTGGSGGAGIVGDGSGKIGPRAGRKADLVDSLGSRPPTQSDLIEPLKPDNGDDIALKLDKPEDITEQNGKDQDVEKPEDSEDGIKVSEQGRIEFPNGGNLNSDQGSISFKIKPEWSGSDQTDNALVQVRQEHEWSNRIEVVKNGEFLRFILTDDTGKEADISSRISNWQPGENHDLVLTWGEGRTTMWVDGQVVGQNEYPGKLQIKEHTPMYVGADWRGSNYAGANSTFYGFTVSTTSSHP